MRKIIFVAALLSCFYMEINAQSSGWSFINPLPTNVTLKSVKIFDQNNAIAIGYYGTVIRTTNGGINWSNPLTTSALTGLDPLHYYYDMSFFNENTGLIIGDDGGMTSKIFKTTNMGIAWTFVSQFDAIARTMYFINQNTGWVGAENQILRTTNGGSNWQSSITSLPSYIRSIFFQNETTGFAAMDYQIFSTSNGGMNWNVIDSSAALYSDLIFINSQTGFVCGSGASFRGLIRKTTNSGVTWITKVLNGQSSTPLSSIYFINDLTGLAVGGYYGNLPANIFRTTDQGESWSQISVATTYELNAIGFSGNLGLIVGEGGKIARSTDQGLNWSVSTSFHPPGLNFYTLSFIDANTGWIGIGGNTTEAAPIYKSTNGGLNWNIIYMSPVYPDYIQFLNASTGYLKIAYGLFKSINSGNSWMELPTFNFRVNSINFIDVNTGWACGDAYPTTPKLTKTVNGGYTWNEVPVPMDYSSVAAFYFINDNTGWISETYSGSWCRIYKTTNGGQNWVTLPTDTNVVCSKISFVNSLTGWASGDEIIKTTNGGNSWISLQLNGPDLKCQFIDANNGWAKSDVGPIYKTTNGGLNWHSQVDLGIGYSNIECMQFINSQTGWMVGYDGLIIKTTSGGEVVSLNNISSTLPKEFSVLQNYPNPFNPSTVIRFQIASNNFVKLVIYDVLGREVAKLVNQQMQPGSYSVDWDASNYSSGVYFYKLEAGDYTQTRKMVLIK